jgi:hypothetical protein
MDKDFCELLIEYSRHNVVSNEQQMLACSLSMLTCFAPNPKEYISTFVVGESSGGKTHLQTMCLDLMPSSVIFDLTSSSEKAMIYSEDLRYNDEIKFIKFAEYQKLPHAVLEYLKSLSGDDPNFVYEVTNAAKGRTERMEHCKRPYSVTYAQVEIDHELKSRVFVIPIMENYAINRCVAAIQFGVEEVEYLGTKYDMSECEDIEIQIRDNISSLASMPMDVNIPYPMALVDMVNHSKAVSKRHSNLIASLIKSSCRVNWVNRESFDGKLIANAQDIANVLVMFDLLRATMMSVDIIDMSIYKKLCKSPNQSEESLVSYLQNMGLAELTKTELHRRLGKLYDENYIIKEGTSIGNLYRGNDQKQILKLNVDWNEIYKCDQSEVTDVISGIKYKSIKEFGDYIEHEYEINNTDIEEIMNTDISSLEADIRSMAIDTISEGDYDSISRIAYAVLNNPDWQKRTKETDYFQIATDILPVMEKEGLIMKNTNGIYMVNR